MTMMEAVKVIVALREAAVLETIPVVTLNESITITVLETATLAALGELRSTPPGPGITMAAAVMPRHRAVMTTAAAVAHSRATSAAHYFRTTSTAAPSATVATAMAATVTTATVADERNVTVNRAERTLQVGNAGVCLPHYHRCKKQAARKGSYCSYTHCHEYISLGTPERDPVRRFGYELNPKEPAESEVLCFFA